MTASEYNKCVDLHSHAIFRFAIKKLRNTDDAKEIVQISFEKLYVYNYRFQSNFVRLTENAPEFQAITVGGPTVDPIPMEKSKLVANYIGVPLAIGWQSNPSRWETSESDGSTTSYNQTPKFSIKAGVHTGYLLSTHAKLKESGGNTTKQYDDFNLNNFIIAPFINFEYEDLGVYMRYPLTNIFKTGQGANSQCLQFGITLKFT